MLSKRFATLLAVSALGLSSSAALAGFTAVIGNVDVTNTGGAITTTTPGTVLAYIPQTPADPQLSGGDIAFFKLSLTGTFVTPPGGSIIGTYLLFYDQNQNGLFDEGIRISSGNFNFNAGALNADNAYPLDGSLTQLLGPNNPALADLTYGQPNNPLSFTGFYTPVGAQSGIAGLVVQGLAIPEPAAMSLLGLPVLALGRRRR